MMTNLLVPAATALTACMVLLGSPRAQTVTGQVVNSQAQGVPGVDVDFDGGGPTATTGPGGFFSVVVAAETYDIDFLPPTTTLAPIQLLDVVIAGNTNLGTITLPHGFAFEQSTGQRLFTPNDGVNVLGTFQVVVPAGTYRVRAKPPQGVLLVAQELEDVVVSGATSVGTITLPWGFLVTGRAVDAPSSAPLANVDLDVDDAVTSKRLVTPNDNTNGSGQFTLILPTGLFHLSFDPPVGTSRSAAPPAWERSL
jgi:hypothetical protein